MEVSTMAAPWKARQGGMGAADCAKVGPRSGEGVAIARTRRRVVMVEKKD